MKSNKFINLKNTLPVIVGVASYALTNTNIALAASTGVPEVDQGLNVVKGIAIGVCSIIGIVALVKGGMTFSSGISQRDQSGIVTGGLEFAGGLIMATIATVIGLMGF